jgi:hypothetical protein
MKKSTLQQTQKLLPKEYTKLLEYIKKDIQRTQLNAAAAVTKELTLLYWRIGKELSEKTQLENWGSKVVEKLAHDLRNAFPGIAGFSRTNIYRMMAFYEAYPNCLTAVGQFGGKRLN